MFKKSEIEPELHARLKAAGLNPLDPTVKAINDLARIMQRMLADVV